MGNIIVVAYLVSCSPNQLACEDLNTASQKWRDPAHCAAALPQLKRKWEKFGYRNVKGRCHYIIDGNPVPVG